MSYGRKTNETKIYNNKKINIMVIKIYNDTILTPVKCGTRYLDKIWEDKRIYSGHEKYLKFPKVNYIIVREPMSHLISALHTETLDWMNHYTDKDDFYHQLNEFISNEGSTHWCVPFYEYFYYYRNKYGNDIEVVKLENLTELLKQLGYDIEYTPEEYHFKEYKKWWPKDELFQMLKDMYPKEINLLLDKVKIQTEYYNKLINNEIDNRMVGNLI
jgi:hypothetical protein